MTNLRNLTCLLCAITLMCTASALVAQDQPAGGSADADALIAEIQATKPPPFDRSKMEDKDYRKQYSEQVKQAMTKRAELAKQFYDKFPDHPKAAKMMED